MFASRELVNKAAVPGFRSTREEVQVESSSLLGEIRPSPDAHIAMASNLLASLLLVVRPGAPSSVLAPSSEARRPK